MGRPTPPEPFQTLIEEVDTPLAVPKTYGVFSAAGPSAYIDISTLPGSTATRVVMFINAVFAEGVEAGVALYDFGVGIPPSERRTYLIQKDVPEDNANTSLRDELSGCSLPSRFKITISPTGGGLFFRLYLSSFSATSPI